MTTRIQRSRRKGWRLPAGAVCVSRPSVWGNPFRVDEMGHQSAVDAYRWWLMFDAEGKKIAERARTELRGKVLACWCPLTKACHADVLIDAAEGRLWRDWIIEGNLLIRSRRRGQRWIASVYGLPKRSIIFGIMPCSGQTVLGEYSSRGEAIEEARTQIALSGEERVCTLAEIDRVRRENKKAG